MRRLGYDPIASLDKLDGVISVFASGDLPDVSAGFLADVAKKPRGVFAVDGARFGLALLAPADFQAKPLGFGGPFSFSTPVEGLIGTEVAVAESKGRLGVLVAPDGPEAAFEPEDTVGESEAYLSALEEIGEGWT